MATSNADETVEMDEPLHGKKPPENPDATVEMEAPLHVPKKRDPDRKGPGPLIALGLLAVLLVGGAEVARRTIGTKVGSFCKTESDCVGWSQLCVVPPGELPYCSRECVENSQCGEGYTCEKTTVSIYDENLRSHMPMERHACVVFQ